MPDSSEAAGKKEALLSIKEFPNDYEIITPSLSILAEPSVAIVDRIVDKKGTNEIAEEYIKYLYSDEGQEIAAQNFYRPRNPKILAKYSNTFKPLKLFTIKDKFAAGSANILQTAASSIRFIQDEFSLTDYF